MSWFTVVTPITGTSSSLSSTTARNVCPKICMETIEPSNELIDYLASPGAWRGFYLISENGFSFAHVLPPDKLLSAAGRHA